MDTPPESQTRNLPPVEDLRDLLTHIKMRDGNNAPWVNPDDPKYGRAGRDFIEQYNQGLEPPANYRPTNVRPIRPGVKHNGHDSGFTFASKSWGQIQDTEYPDVRWIIPGIIPEGLTVISGPPKIGKSWLALNLCIAVAAGGVALGTISVAQAKVLYLALEDSERRIKKRTQAILDQLEQTPAIRDTLHFVTLAARLDNGLIDSIQNFLVANPDTSFIVIDTLAKVRPTKRNRGQNSYETDYADLCALQTICSQKQISISLLTHNRKLSAEDVLEDISGSMGISGSADTLLIMKRARGSNEASVFITGRDIEEETTYAMTFDKNVKTWCITDQGPTVGISEEKQDILDIVRDFGGKRAIELTRLMHGEDTTTKSKEHKRVAKHLAEMVEARLVRKEGDFYFYHA